MPVPDPIRLLEAIDPSFHAGYLAARGAVMDNSDGGLSPAEKEVVLLTLDVVRGNLEAAIFHARLAMDHGVSLRGILDALQLTFLVGGAATWGITGAHVYADCCDYTPRSGGA